MYEKHTKSGFERYPPRVESYLSDKITRKHQIYSASVPLGPNELNNVQRQARTVPAAA